MGMLAKSLRQIAKRGQYGHPRTPSTFMMGEDYCTYYWSGCQFMVTHAEWVKIAKLSTRYLRFYHYVTEVSAGWQTVDETGYADNSTYANQRNKHGATRQVMLTAPSGDACF